MPPIDSNLLNKIQSIKTLRDRAGTDGEKDAAQHKLTIILAKHKLTEQDIPSPNFSTRLRYRPPQSQPFQRPSSRRGPHNKRMWKEWEDLFARMAAEAAFQSKATTSETRGKDHAFKSSKRTMRQRFEQAVGRPVSDHAWHYLVKSTFQDRARKDKPSNRNAYARAFYEAAGYRIRERLTGIMMYGSANPKSRNEAGIKAGKLFGERAPLDWFNKEPS